MRKSTKRLLSGLALAAGVFGAAGAYLTKKKNVNANRQGAASNPGSVWARPSMTVSFRAELMPGRERDERTFRVKALLKNGRVLLEGVAGEHAEKEFEPIH